MGAQQLLDHIQSYARLDALDPEAWAAAVEAELVAGDDVAALEARDGQLRAALGQIDAMIERAARLGMEQALAMDHSIGAPTRRVFATTVASYAGRLDVLAARARDVAARGGAGDPDDVAARVVEVARRVLEVRDALRAAVLTRVQRLSIAAAVIADQRARDPRRDEPSRKTWSAIRRDLEAIAARPEAIASAAMTTRVAAWPEQLDDAAPEIAPSLADLIELD